LKLVICSEIQLKSPNWVFGQRKYEENVCAPKVTSSEISKGRSQDEAGADALCDLGLLSSLTDVGEEDIFQRCPLSLFKPLCLVYHGHLHGLNFLGTFIPLCGLLMVITLTVIMIRVQLLLFILCLFSIMHVYLLPN